MQTATVIDQRADNLKPSSGSWDCWRVNVLIKFVLDTITQFWHGGPAEIKSIACDDHAESKVKKGMIIYIYIYMLDIHVFMCFRSLQKHQKNTSRESQTISIPAPLEGSVVAADCQSCAATPERPFNNSQHQLRFQMAEQSKSEFMPPRTLLVSGAQLAHLALRTRNCITMERVQQKYNSMIQYDGSEG